MKITSDYKLDATEMSCPLPILKTKEMMNTMHPGEVLEIHSTDPGTKVDLIAWSDGNNEHYLGTFEQEDRSIHYIKKSAQETVAIEKGKVLSLDALEDEMKRTNGMLIDVREKEEFNSGHITEAISIPLGEFKEHIPTLDRNKDLFLICRSGNRSGMAQKVLEDSGFKNVMNVVPGMQGWAGTIQTNDGGKI